MFYKIIQQRRDQWYASPDCTVRDLVAYIEQRGMMRDAQVDAIRTYLFLKIACKNQPLWKLFSSGMMGDAHLDAEELTVEARQVLTDNPAALALFQYSRLKDKSGRQVGAELEKHIRQHAAEIDYIQAFRDIFYGISYTDYLFSLPMGAGKTFLMAAFIYIDLYFAQNEPENPAWAHNFLVLAPSGLKSSIIPSLKSIRSFDPTWIFPKETADNLRRLIRFEILDEQKSANKSNAVRNPNAHKVNNHLADGNTMGLIAITNAEKVILDRMEEADKNPNLFSDDERKKIAVANELRMIIGKLPHLSILIDEVHHATDGDIKLRQVVGQWAAGSKFCGVLGFSGTPYLEKAEKITLSNFTIKNTDISNVVYFYPLIDGIDNFLKRPVVKHADSDSSSILSEGVREFLDRYRDTVYADGTCAKLAIYCGQIPTLEEEVYPLVAEIVTQYGMNPTEVILKRHKGSTSKKDAVKYPEPEGSEAAFAALDSAYSKVRIVLLVQIGKEGWDCKSLTGIILPHEGACPKNMVLQTSCRCLRQTQRGANETALIWMNRWNADKLNKELQQQQNITLQQFANKPQRPLTTFNRYNRMEQQRVPPIDFMQLKVSYETRVIEDQPDTHARLTAPSLLVKASDTLAAVQDMQGKIVEWQELTREGGEQISYSRWLHKISRESMGTLPVSSLQRYNDDLQIIFSQITISTDGEPTENPDFDHQRIRSLIRQSFVPKRDFRVVEEVVPDEASLLAIDNFKSTFSVHDATKVYPVPNVVNEIRDWDEHPEQGEVSADKLAMLEQMKQMPGMTDEMLATMQQGIMAGVKQDPHPERLQTYQYLPYRFDSGLEVAYFTECLMTTLSGTQLEYYFNGDDTLTEFKIRCYRKHGSHWVYDGLYVPDFLVLSRDAEGHIDRICIIETKGEGYAAKFSERLKFMQDTFVPKNNEHYGRDRFRFLYLEDTIKPELRVTKTKQMIKDFFNV